MEFYFSNSNLPRDKFLKEIYDSEDGWVPVATLASFKRMQSITTDLAAVVAALRKSAFLKLSDDESKVTRREPLPAVEDLQMSKASIVFIRNLPLTATLDGIQSFFQSDRFGKLDVKCVRMKRAKDRAFRGAIFMELATEAEAKAFAEQFNGKVVYEEPAAATPAAAPAAAADAAAEVKEEAKPMEIFTRDEYFKIKKAESAAAEAAEGGPKKGKKRKVRGRGLHKIRARLEKRKRSPFFLRTHFDPHDRSHSSFDLFSYLCFVCLFVCLSSG